ncbi:hypothetical protein HY993_05070 [Candidatus Micrarchaeota archaeon]|nr:hypothetical protein [Candidatus Micrarchaeota archaeon]
MARGREKQVTCEKCGRQVRRDKAVFIEKVMFSNPIEKKDVYDTQYTPRLMREVAYCPSCGKHLRIYDKKIQQNIREAQRKERQSLNTFSRKKKASWNAETGAIQNPDLQPQADDNPQGGQAQESSQPKW